MFSCCVKTQRPAMPPCLHVTRCRSWALRSHFRRVERKLPLDASGWLRETAQLELFEEAMAASTWLGHVGAVIDLLRSR